MPSSITDIRSRAQDAWQALEQPARPSVFVGTATCGQAAGALETMAAFKAQQAKQGLGLSLTPVGCMGPCYLEPLVAIRKPSQPMILYGNVDAKAAAKLTQNWLLGQNPCADLALGVFGDQRLDGIAPLASHPMFRGTRLILRNCGLIDPTNFEHCPAQGATRVSKKPCA